MLRILASGLTASVALLVGMQTAEAATVDGATLSAEYLFPDSSTVYPSASTTGEFTAGAGVDAVIDVEGVTSLALDFAGNTLTVTFSTILTAPTWNNSSFNGLHITMSSGGVFDFFGLSSATIGPITTSFDADELFINWAGASYVDGSTAVFDISMTPAPVPLPGGLPLLGAGIAGLVALRRRKASAA